MTELPRRLGLLSTIAVLIGITIGSGIFRTPARIADRLPGPLPMLSVWAVAGLTPAIMFVTGAVIWWNRVLRKARRGSQPTAAQRVG